MARNGRDDDDDSDGVRASQETPSRHLDFRNVSQDDEGAETQRARRESRTPSREAPAASPGTPQRRSAVPWTPEEERVLAEGVRDYGLGKWRYILEDGRKVFHRHRTNVDLKDKWKNMVRREAMSPEQAARARKRHDPAAMQMVREVLPTLRKQPRRLSMNTSSRRANQGDSVGHEPEHDERSVDNSDDDEGSHQSKRRRSSSEISSDTLRLLIGTDESFPRLQSVFVSSQSCSTVSALKRELSRRLLQDSPLPTNLLLVSIKTRRLLGDLEPVDECLERDGRELFLLYDP